MDRRSEDEAVGEMYVVPCFQLTTSYGSRFVKKERFVEECAPKFRLASLYRRISMRNYTTLILSALSINNIVEAARQVLKYRGKNAAGRRTT